MAGSAGPSDPCPKNNSFPFSDLANPGPVTYYQVKCGIAAVKALNLTPAPYNYGKYQKQYSAGNHAYLLKSYAILYSLIDRVAVPAGYPAFDKIELMKEMARFSTAAILGRHDYYDNGSKLWSDPLYAGKPNPDALWLYKGGDEPFSGFTGTGDGTTAGLIADVAKLILKDESIWDQKIPTDEAFRKAFKFGPAHVSLLQLAMLYVTEMTKTTEALHKYFANEHGFGVLQRFPVDPSQTIDPSQPEDSVKRIAIQGDGDGFTQSTQPVVPWNQQAQLNHGFQSVAEAYDLLVSKKLVLPVDLNHHFGIGHANGGSAAWRARWDDKYKARYEKLSGAYDEIVSGSLKSFFSVAKRASITVSEGAKVSLPDENSADNDIHSTLLWPEFLSTNHYEDTGHGGSDISWIYRAYEGNRYKDDSGKRMPSVGAMRRIANGFVDVFVQDLNDDDKALATYDAANCFYKISRTIDGTSQYIDTVDANKNPIRYIRCIPIGSGDYPNLLVFRPQEYERIISGYNIAYNALHLERYFQILYARDKIFNRK